MQCPACCQNSLGVRQRLRIAARAQSRCPACGIAIRFGFWPRLFQTLFGEAFLLLAVAGTFFWQAPIVVVLATSSWLSLALLLPVQPDPRDPLTLRHVTGGGADG